MRYIKNFINFIVDYFTIYKPVDGASKRPRFVKNKQKTPVFTVKKGTAVIAAITAAVTIPVAVSANALFSGTATGVKNQAKGTLIVEELKNADDSVTITSVIAAEDVKKSDSNNENKIVPAYQPEEQTVQPTAQQPMEIPVPGLENTAVEYKVEETVKPQQTQTTGDVSVLHSAENAAQSTAQTVIPAQTADTGQNGVQAAAQPQTVQTANADQIVTPNISEVANPSQAGTLISETVTADQDTKAVSPAGEAVNTQESSPQIKDLVPESNSADVKALQQRLMELGYMDNDEPTDYYGPATQWAVRYFQRKHGLTNDGYAGEQTQALLFSDAAQPYSVTLGADGPDVERIQERLAQLGYPVTASGYFGTDTDYAVRYFQRMNGLTDDGSVGLYTKEVLYSDAAEPALEYKANKPAESQSGSTSENKAEKSSSQKSDSASYTADPGNVEAFISAAMAQVGKTYVLGGKGPNVFDCSGFVYYALKQSGNGIGYMTSGGWANSGYTTISSIDGLKRGDVICMTGHVGIYLGNGQMVDASSSLGKIVVRDVGPWARRNFICGKRPL